MRHILIHAIVVLGMITPLMAQTPQPTAPPEAPPEAPQAAPPPEPDRVWMRMKIDVPGRYYYRGWKQERHGVIVQPALRIGADLWRSDDGPINRVSTLVGTRNSFHSKQTMADETGPSIWYESDIVGGFQVQFLERAQAELLYAAITSPNGAFDTIQEINLNLSYDDAGLWPGAFSVEPYLDFKFEIDGSAVAGPRGTLMQLGVDPGFQPFGPESLPLRLSFPVEAGISLNNYYYLPEPFAGADDTFGYAKAGVSISMPLLFIPQDYGQWGMTVGVDYIHLGDNLETFNSGRDHDIVPRLTIGAQF